MLLPFSGKAPVIADSALILPTATVIGDVVVGDESSIWFNVVVRGDVNLIRIGKQTNVQDGAVVHVTSRSHPTFLGDEVTVGHHVTLHGCRIGTRCLIGIGAIVLDGAVIGDEAIIGAGAVVSPGSEIPSRCLALGTPARVKRGLNELEVRQLGQSAANYVQYLRAYRQLLGSGHEFRAEPTGPEGRPG
jgi:carbonic anhydrase/acetyltransferase-like protein (isoleucine patch superfamily)